MPTNQEVEKQFKLLKATGKINSETDAFIEGIIFAINSETDKSVENINKKLEVKT